MSMEVARSVEVAGFLHCYFSYSRSFHFQFAVRELLNFARLFENLFHIAGTEKNISTKAKHHFLKTSFYSLKLRKKVINPANEI